VIDSESKIEFGKNKLSVFSIAMQKIAQIVEKWTRVDYIKIIPNFSKLFRFFKNPSSKTLKIIRLFAYCSNYTNLSQFSNTTYPHPYPYLYPHPDPNRCRAFFKSFKLVLAFRNNIFE